MTNSQCTNISLTKTNKNQTPTTDYLVSELAQQNILFYDQYDEPWFSPYGGSELYRIRSRKFKGWLGAYVYSKYKFALKNNQIKDISEALGGIALYSGAGQKNLEVRSCLVDNSLWYDLGGSAVRVDESGWEVIEQPPILFKPYEHQEQQVVPSKNGNIQALRQFVNISSDEDWALFLVFAISTFIPSFPQPVLVLTGSQGAGKTTPMRMLKKLVDPSKLPSTGSPSDQEEMSRLADKHSLLFFDNLSSLSPKVSDILCKLVTGDGFSRRTKYTDDDETIFVSKRAIMMNGINSFITRADLLDRTIILELGRIPDNKRLPEDELWRRFEEERPKILGGIFDILSRAMSLYGSNVPDKLPRMADFAKWGVAINSAIKQVDESWTVDFIEAYEKNIECQNEEAIQANPVAVAVRMLVKEKIVWEGSATDLLHEFETSTDIEMCYLTKHVMWPKDSARLGRSLMRAETNLKRAHITIEKFRKNNSQMLRITDESRKDECEAFHALSKAEQVKIEQAKYYKTSCDNSAEMRAERQRAEKCWRAWNERLENCSAETRERVNAVHDKMLRGEDITPEEELSLTWKLW